SIKSGPNGQIHALRLDPLPVNLTPSYVDLKPLIDVSDKSERFCGTIFSFIENPRSISALP
ncbi:unnamed protein product, partial [Rotaria sp. Silwood2]